MSELLLITPPFTQLNTPYPATAYLKGFLNTKGISAFQMDLGIEVILSLFSEEGLRSVFDYAEEYQTMESANSHRIFALRNRYLRTIGPVVAFLQGHDPTYSRLIATENFLPRAERFAQLDELEWAFGNMGVMDKAKHLATLYLEDLSDFIIECVDDHFGFSRYAERLGMSANSFDELYEELQDEATFIDTYTLEILQQRLEKAQPQLVCFSVPFPGNLYSAFRCAKFLKTNYPEIKVAMGGGFPNTELRSLKDVRVFEFFDFITLDDGELPIELLVRQLADTSGSLPVLKRTFHLWEGEAYYNNSSKEKDYKQSEIGTPDYTDLLLDQYISVIEVVNPMHSLWSDGRWNKLTMAHGCYWGKCTFCDVSLDYIRLYEPVTAKMLADRMEELIAQTGTTGFHFVDEAAPPALMRALALEIIKRNLSVTWWTNIRFEKSFTLDLCLLLKAAGCIAVSGGLEVASDRLLEVIDKGVTVEQVAVVLRNFTEAGIMAHAYLMYGYPTQTVQETIDSLEMVRQLFESGVLQSGFWHQFALTAHSPVGMAPAEYGITPHYETIEFANNDVQFEDSTGINHDLCSDGLKKSLFNYMHGMCFEYALSEWFDFEVPQTSVDKDYIVDCLQAEPFVQVRKTAKIAWIGEEPLLFEEPKKRKGREQLRMELFDGTGDYSLKMDREEGEWLFRFLQEIAIMDGGRPATYETMKSEYEAAFADFEPFWYSKPVEVLRQTGLLVL